MARIAGRDISNNELGVMIAGVVLFAASLFDWFSISYGAASTGQNAWGVGFFAYGGVELGLLAAALVAVRVFTRVQLPAVGVDWVLVTAAVAGLGTLLILLKTAIGLHGLDRAAGLWLGLVASLALTVFAVLTAMAKGYNLPGRGGRSHSPYPPAPGIQYDSYGRPVEGGYGQTGPYGQPPQAGSGQPPYGQSPYGQPPQGGYNQPGQ